MKIERNKNEDFTTVGATLFGECFDDGYGIYMVTRDYGSNHTRIQCVNITTGNIKAFDIDAKVIKVNAKVVIE
jgi:hypothetical protein